MEENNNDQIIVDIGLDALIASLRELQKQYEANTAAMKAMRDEGKQDSDEYIQLTQANKVLRQEMNGVEKSIQNNIKAEKAQEGSLVQLRAQLANLNKQYDSMSGFERMGTAGEELRKKIKALSDNISNLASNRCKVRISICSYGVPFFTPYSAFSNLHHLCIPQSRG
jgi:chromosome segregation ATPase